LLVLWWVLLLLLLPAAAAATEEAAAAVYCRSVRECFRLLLSGWLRMPLRLRR